MLYPCDVGPHRASGPQASIYPAIADGIRADRRKMRLCSRHFPELATRIEDYCMAAQTEMDADVRLLCIECGQPAADAEWQFFATVYRVGQDRADYWTTVHGGCREAALRRWALPE